MDCSTPGLPVHHQLPGFTQIYARWVSDAIQPSHPLSSPSPPDFNLSQHPGLFQWLSSLHRWPKYWSFSFSINPSNEYSGLISFRMDWLDLLAVQETLKSLLQHHSSKASILPHSTFRWLGHYIYWYDLVHLAIWFLFVLSVLCFPFSLILPYLKLSGYLCIIFVFNWYYFFLKCLDKILFICFVRVLVILYYFRCCFTVHSIHF